MNREPAIFHHMSAPHVNLIFFCLLLDFFALPIPVSTCKVSNPNKFSAS